MPTGRTVPGALTPEQTAARLLAQPGTCALVFGDEVRGLTNRELQRGAAVATIPTAHKSSLNLAQAVLVFGYEILKARGSASFPEAPPEPQADERLLSLLRDRARALLLASGFLNPQQPDLVLYELVSLVPRARPPRRVVGPLRAAISPLS